jgi:hypothetical protein
MQSLSGCLFNHVATFGPMKTHNPWNIKRIFIFFIFCVANAVLFVTRKAGDGVMECMLFFDNGAMDGSVHE